MLVSVLVSVLVSGLALTAGCGAGAGGQGARAADARAHAASAERPPGALASAPAVRELTPARVRELLWPARTPTVLGMAEGERVALGALVEALAEAAHRGGDLRALAARAAEAGMVLELWRVRGHVFWALLEAPERRRGAGAYVFAPGPASGRRGGDFEYVLQAPHAYFDRGTGDIAAALFFGPGRGRVRAFFTNSVYRYAGMPAAEVADAADAETSADANDEGETGADETDAAAEGGAETAPSRARKRRRHTPLDVAHAREHGFLAATAAVARVFDQVVVIQLHGFAEREGAPEFIISTGADDGAWLLSSLAQALGAVFERVWRYPEDTAILGGRRNLQGRLLAESPRAHFLHVELSAKLRTRLRSSPGLRVDLADALLTLPAPAMSGEDADAPPSPR
ncbi:hypothetical protein [Haliangium ochraceum]|nr:hypothetical protein [Haliangium ochraceum]